MAAPSPTPTEAQLVTVAEITMTDAEDALTLVSQDALAYSSAKWARTLTDITTWADIENEAGDIKKVGSIEFFEGYIGMSRLAFRNKVRQRYGLDLLADETGSEFESVSSLEWF